VSKKNDSDIIGKFDFDLYKVLKPFQSMCSYHQCIVGTC